MGQSSENNFFSVVVKSTVLSRKIISTMNETGIVRHSIIQILTTEWSFIIARYENYNYV
jgi:hypothetical protein